MNHLTIEQRIAQKEDELTRLKDQKRKIQTGQKIIIGGAVLKAAKNNLKISKWLLEILEAEVTRDNDVKRIKPILMELNKQ